MYRVELGDGLKKLLEASDKSFDLVYAGLWNDISREDMATVVKQASRIARNAIVLQPVTCSDAVRLFAMFEDAGFHPRLETGIKIQQTLTAHAPLRSTQQMVVVPMAGAPTSRRNELEVDFNRPYAQHVDQRGATTGNDITAKLPSAHRANPKGTRRLRDFFVMPAERKSKTIDQPSQPITTAARFIAEWTNPIVGSVLDFSCGSGTTGEACLRLYRDFVGVDNDPVKITLSRNRLKTIKPKSMQFEMAELNRQIVNDLARVKKWAPETL